MKIIKSNNITVFDVDSTLLLYERIRTKEQGKIAFNYGDEIIYLRPHNFHPTFLKHCHNRGDFVIVWSKNGVSWAEQAVKKLKLTKYVDLVMSKPSRYVDDKTDMPSVCGDHIFIAEVEE